MLFRSKASHIIYKALNPEDKDNFLNSKIVDKISDREFWENSARGPIKLTAKLIKQVVTELHEKPYAPYAILKFP